MSRWTMRLPMAVVSGLVVLFVVPLVCVALTAPAAADLLADLDSDDFEKREEASSRLLSDQAMTEDRLAELLRKSTTPEQRHRLIAAAKHHVLREARLADFGTEGNASLGISHDAVNLVDEDGRKLGAVYVILTLPGFPGHAVLRSGDLIMAVDGKPIPPDMPRDRFATIIQGYSAGQKIGMTVRRGERTLEVEATLTSSKALETMYDGATVEPTFRYEELWRAARARLEADLPAVPVVEVPDAE